MSPSCVDTGSNLPTPIPAGNGIYEITRTYLTSCKVIKLSKKQLVTAVAFLSCAYENKLSSFLFEY